MMVADRYDTSTDQAAFHEMKRLLALPEAWSRSGVSLDAEGRVVHPSAPGAVLWGLPGAFMRVLDHQVYRQMCLTKDLTIAGQQVFGPSFQHMETFNRNRRTSHFQVHLLLDQAIANAIAKTEEKTHGEDTGHDDPQPATDDQA